MYPRHCEARSAEAIQKNYYINQMKTEYFKEYSKNLNREMEFKVYGHAGKPVLMFPTQCCRFYEFEDKHMIDVYAPYIEQGKVQVFAIDSVDSETYVSDGDCRGRIWWYEQWIKYVVEEAIPRFLQISAAANKNAANNNAANDTAANGKIKKFIAVGESMGALHASTVYFRFPDFFDGLLCLSGLYTNEYYFGGYHDDLTYINSPQQFIKNMPADHPYINKYLKSEIIICVGQGAWESECVDSTRVFAGALAEKNIGARVEFWGDDVNHDWDWWFVQTAKFLPALIK